MSEYSIFYHNITPDRVVFAYRQGDSDSIEVAEHYRTKRGIPAENLIPLPCSNSYSVSYDEYLETIENPIRDKILFLDSGPSSGGGSSGQKEIFVIILGYNVPVVYVNEDPYIPYKAIASRLHRLGFAEEDKYPNYIYDRQEFKFFDQEDSAGLYITAVINAQSKEKAIALIDRSIDVDNQNFITGKIILDPYGLKSTSLQTQYRDSILDFISNGSSDLGLVVEKTVEPLNGSDPLVRFLSGESFYWGWYTPQYSTDLVLNQNQRRVFLYNADGEAATTFTEGPDEDGSDPWCTVAINANPGYACCAGAVSAAGEDSYLRPRPFFKALQQGACIGEAFLLASPVVDWKIILIGDPLMVVNFPSDIPNEQEISYQLIENNEGIRLVKESLEESIAYAIRQSRLAEDLLEFAYQSVDLEEEIELLYPINQWKNIRNESDQFNLFSSPVISFVRYIKSTTGIDFSAWLERNNEKTTEFMQRLISSGIPTIPIPDSLIHDEGSWQYDFYYIHPRQRLENVFFELEISRNSTFTDIVANASSLSDIEGWKYEQNKNKFVQLISEGLPSSFSGRRVRFISPTSKYLVRTNTYFVRWRSVDYLGVVIKNWTQDENEMIIKR